MKYIDEFRKILDRLKTEGKYRVFNTILRKRGNLSINAILRLESAREHANALPFGPAPIIAIS